VTAGITFNGIPVRTDRESRLLIGNLAQYAATLPPQSIIDFTRDGVVMASNAINLNDQINALVQQGRSIEARCFARKTV
jgi:hypothetical protein